METAFWSKIFDEWLEHRRDLAFQGSQAVDKGECTYDASKGLQNWVESVADQLDVSAMQMGSHSCIAYMSIFVNVSTLLPVSRGYLKIDRDITATRHGVSPVLYLEIRLGRKPVSLGEVHLRAQKYRDSIDKLAKTGEGVVSPVKLYDLEREYFLSVGDDNSRLHFDGDPETWVLANGGWDLNTLRIPEDLLKISAGVACSPNIEGADLIRCALAGMYGEDMVVRDLALVDPERPTSSDCNEWSCWDCGRRTRNLWLNLSDGYIGCGRRQYGVESDGCGCMNGKEGAAIRHFQENQSFHVCVKLGSIGPHSADVYSYKLDGPVIDPELEVHLSRLGIDRKKLVQSEKCTDEISLEKNEKLVFGEVEGRFPTAQLERVSCPRKGERGTVNIGNSCYMGTISQMLSFVYSEGGETGDSVLKTLLEKGLDAQSSLLFQFHRQICSLNQGTEMVEKFAKRYHELKEYVRKETEAKDPNLLAALQLGTVLNDSSRDPDFKYGAIVPTKMKLRVGQLRPRFGTSEQQDAEEYYQFLYSQVCLEEETVFGFSQLRSLLEVGLVVEPNKRDESRACDAPLLAMTLPGNIPAGESFSLQRDLLPRWHHSNNHWIYHFPKFLVIHLQRVSLDESGKTPVKSQAPIALEDQLDLSQYICPKTLFAIALENSKTGLSEKQERINPKLLEDLTSLGFTESQIKAAYKKCPEDRKTNTELMVDYMLSVEVEEPESAVDEGKVNMLLDVGFDRELAVKALRKFHEDVELSINALLTNPSSVEDGEVVAVPLPSLQRDELEVAKYQLRGVLVHLGSNAHSGHYVIYLVLYQLDTN